MYKRLKNEFAGVLTGKSLNWGGSLIRPEATEYGAAYFLQEMLASRATTWSVPILAVLSRWWMPCWIKALYRISWKNAYTNAVFI